MNENYFTLNWAYFEFEIFEYFQFYLDLYLVKLKLNIKKN